MFTVQCFKLGGSVAHPLIGRYVLGGYVKFLSIVEAILKPRARRREEARSGRIKDEYAESEFQDALKLAEKNERKTYDKYKDEW